MKSLDDFCDISLPAISNMLNNAGNSEKDMNHNANELGGYTMGSEQAGYGGMVQNITSMEN